MWGYLTFNSSGIKYFGLGLGDGVECLSGFGCQIRNLTYGNPSIFVGRNSIPTDLGLIRPWVIVKTLISITGMGLGGLSGFGCQIRNLTYGNLGFRLKLNPGLDVKLEI